LTKPLTKPKLTNTNTLFLYTLALSYFEEILDDGQSYIKLCKILQNLATRYHQMEGVQEE